MGGGLGKDWRGRSAAQAAGRIECVHAEKLVDEAAGDAEHGGAAVVALGVELEGALLRVGVALPDLAANVARRLVCSHSLSIHTNTPIYGRFY